MVVLKGKRASIGKADLAERNASRCARQVDSVASHRTMDKSDHYARDTVGIYKPPNITWWPWAILAAAIAVVSITLHKKLKPITHFVNRRKGAARK